jgi:CubicO group peptidase (beta-lactamase class C family)
MTNPPQSIAELEQWIERRLQAAGTPGAAVILERRGEVLLARGFGYRDVEAGAIADIDTVFGSGSVTKSLTALAVLLLEEDRRLTTQDLVTAHLPELHLPGAEAAAITIHHLLTHTAGLPPLPSRHYAWLSQDDLEPFERAGLKPLPAREPIRSFAELIAFLGEHPFEPHAPPGTQFSYSNEGYNLLGAIIERVSGQSLPDFVRDRILIPAGMRRSSLDLAFTLSLDNVTRLYVGQDDKVTASANWFNPACWLAAGGLRTTARDLVRFFRMLAQGGVIEGSRIASLQSVARMTSAYTPGLVGDSYGYGLSVSDLSGHGLASHGGGHKGVSAFAGFVAEDGIVCAVLTNFAGSPAQQVGIGCLQTALGLPLGPLVPTRAPIALAAETLASFCGAYRSGEGANFKVSLDEAGRVVFTQDGQTLLADPTAEDAITFSTPVGGAQTIRFVRMGGGEISHAFTGGRLIKRHETDAPGSR